MASVSVAMEADRDGEEEGGRRSKAKVPTREDILKGSVGAVGKGTKKCGK